MDFLGWKLPIYFFKLVKKTGRSDWKYAFINLHKNPIHAGF